MIGSGEPFGGSRKLRLRGTDSSRPRDTALGTSRRICTPSPRRVGGCPRSPDRSSVRRLRRAVHDSARSKSFLDSGPHVRRTPLALENRSGARDATLKLCRRTSCLPRPCASLALTALVWRRNCFPVWKSRTRKLRRHGRPNWNGVHETSLKVAFRRSAGRPRGPRS